MEDLGRIGVFQSQKKTIPIEVVTDNGTSNDVNVVLNNWKFVLFTRPVDNIHEVNNEGIITKSKNCSKNTCDVLNEGISMFEVCEAINKAKYNKARGFDNMPMEV